MTRSESCCNLCIVCIICPFAPIWLPVVYTYKLFRRLHPRPTPEERAFRKRYADRPRPLPMTRSNLSQVSFTPGHASTSPFLRLPPEIRDRIYSFIFVNRFVIRIQKIPHRLTQTHCLYPFTWDEHRHLRSGAHRCRGYPFPSASEPQSLSLSLIKTCRQVYHEVTSLIYSTNTFEIDNLDNLIYLNQTIIPHRMASIRYMQLSWSFFWLPLCDSDRLPATDRPMDDETWLRFWNIIATRMQGLIGLDLTFRLFRGPYEQEKIWLKPIMGVRGLQQFILEIVYQNYEMINEDGPSEDVLKFRKEVEAVVCQPRNRKLWRARSFDKPTNSEIDSRVVSR